MITIPRRPISLAPHPRLITAMGGVWAITPEGRSALLADVLSGTSDRIRAEMAKSNPRRILGRESHYRAVGMLWEEGDEWFDPFCDAHVRASGIGVFPVRGPIFDRGWMCYTGWDSIRATAEDFAAEILARREQEGRAVPISAIVMPIDSPGGMCAGQSEGCASLRALRELVPIHTVTDLMSCSAAEAIACQGTYSYTSQDAIRGHMGAFSGHWDISGMLTKEGIAAHYFEEPQGGLKTFFASDKELTPEAAAEWQRGVTSAYQAYVQQIVLGRGLTEEQIRATQARVYYGREAIDVGLAQGEATFDELLYGLEAQLAT